MEREIQILFVEDTPADAVLVSHELRKAGLVFRLKRVETKEAFLQELKLNPPEVILSDHGLPVFDGFMALTLARERCPDVPFIFVTGGMGEERTIEAFENGAVDCVLKKDLPKLTLALQRAMQEAESRLLHRAGEADRERMIRQMHGIITDKQNHIVMKICVSCRKIQNAANRWQFMEHYLRDHFHVSFESRFCPDCSRAPLQKR